MTREYLPIVAHGYRIGKEAQVLRELTGRAVSAG